MPRTVIVALWLLIADAVAQTAATIIGIAGEPAGTVLKSAAALVCVLLIVVFLIATTAGGSGMSASVLSGFGCLLGGIAFGFPIVLVVMLGRIPRGVPDGRELLSLVLAFGCGALLLAAGVLLRMPSARLWYAPASEDWSLSTRWTSLARRP